MEILTGIISKIIEYTIEPVGRQVGYLIDYKINLENQRRQLENLDAAKDRMKHMVDEDERKGKKVHTDVQKWLTEANEMIQEANKLLDDECQAKTKCFRGVCPNLVSYHQFSRESSKLAKKIELHEKVEFPSVSYNARLEEIFDTPSKDFMAFESRIFKVKEIMEELRNPDTNLIGLYGLGGVGKSTLVQEVYRQAKKENLFDDVVLVLDVKQFPEAEKKGRIQEKIAKNLDMDVQEGQDMQARAKHLWNRIKDKKSLVILDDVWEAINLEDLGLRPMATCKILLTSRDRVSEMRTHKVFRLDVLGEKESWSLFEKMAGDVVKDGPIQKVATQIAKKCGGLPVLVVAVASALRSERTLEVWKDALRRFKSFDKKGLKKSAYSALEWSYNRLDGEELKPLFLFCGIIVDGSCTIYLSDLLKYSMGLGLVKNVYTVEETRDTLISLSKKLKDYCMLLDIDNEGDGKMHELVRDVAKWIASKDKHAFSRSYGDELKEWPHKDILRKCTWMSLNSCSIPRLPEEPWVCPELRLFKYETDIVHDSREIPSKFFEEMKELEVLDLSNLSIPSLPPSLQFLKNLQTLCLDRCVLGDIALVGHLTNLKVLSLLGSKVKELPKEIGQLTRLQLLDLTGCSELVLISLGVISSLTSLEDLRMGINSFKQWEGEGSFGGRSNASVSELKHLSQLTALDIHIPDANLLPANVFSDTRLERYTILIGDCWLYPDINEMSSNMLKLKLTMNSQFDQGIKLLLERCEHLYLDGVEAANIISHILASDSGKQLKNLHVQNNDEVIAVINSIGWSYSHSHAFPILESLSLYNLVNLETVCCGQLIAQPFQKLRSLTLWNLPKLIGFSSKGSTSVVSTEAEEIILENEIDGPTKLFMNGEVLTPNLTRLILNQCDGLRFLFSSSMAKSLEQLEHIEISKCQMMEEIVSTIGYNQEHTNNMFCNLKSLKLQHLPSLTRFCSGSYIEFSLLETLHIEDCPRLGTFIFDRKSEITSMGKENDDRNSKENLETVIPHFLFDQKVGFPSLESLIIYDLPALMTIWHNQLAQDSFCRLKKVNVYRCHNLINIFAPSMMGRLNALHRLEIWQCQSLQVVFELGGVFEAYDTSTTQLKTFECPNLDFVKIDACERLINIFPASVAKSLEQLTKLSVENCSGLRFLFSSSMARSLVQLKKLTISRCQIMEEIVPTSESSEEDTDRNMFSQLQNLKLRYLPNLTRFCSACRSINFHSLETLLLEDCSKLETFIFDPMSTNITINRATEEIRDSMENIGTDAQYFLFDEKVGFPSLERLIILDMPKLRTIWHSQLDPYSFRKLKLVEVLRCHSLINIFAPSMMGRLNALGTLVIKQCKSLQVVFDMGVVLGVKDAYGTSSTTQLKTFECPNLDLVEMDSCETVKNIFPTSVVKGLQQLRELIVWNCGLLEEIVANEGIETTPEFVFSKVTLVKFRYLPQLRSFYPGLHVSKWPSLKTLVFSECFQAEILASEYSRFQERLDSGPPIRQPFLLVDTIVSVTALEIHIPDAKLLPANMFLDTRLERYTILIGDCWQYPDNYETSSNMLKLKLTTNSQFDEGIKLLLERCEHLYLDGMEAANIISYILASDSGKQLKDLHVQNNDEVTAVINSSHAFPILESLSLYNLVNLETVCCGQLIAQPFQKLRSLTLWNLPKLIGFSSKGSRSVVSTEAEEIILENEIGEVLMPDLTRLILHQCDSLRFLFSFSIATSLIQLTHLEIASCQIMEEIVSTSGYNQEHTNNMFCNLKYLKLQHLPSLTRFCSGSYIEFSLLEILHIEDCPRLGTFIFDCKSEITAMGKENDDRNFNENLETVIPHFLFDQKVGFPSLESLIIYDLPALMTIWHNQLAQDSFCRLKKVNVYRCHNLINIFARSMMGKLNALYTLQIWQCQSLQVVFELRGVFEAYDTSTTQLKTFECPNLDFVEIDACERLINIFPASVAKSLQQLRELIVWNCGILEEIVAKEGIETTPTEEFVFPKVTSLTFQDLPQLRSFYPGLHVSKWPLLKELEFYECGKVEIFASEFSRFQERLDSGLVFTTIKQPFLLVEKGNSFPNLEKLLLDENMEIWYEAHGPLPAELFINLKRIRFSCAHPNSFAFLQKLHGLELLIVLGGPWKEIFVYEGTSSGEIEAVGRTLPHIKRLSLWKMKELMHLGNNDKSQPVFPNLEILKVYECGRLNNLTSSAISFLNLTTLEVGGCEGLKYLTTYSVAKCLHQLKSLKVVDCKSMIEIVASNGDEQDSGNYYEIAFGSLQHLKLSDLPILRGFCSSEICNIRVPSLNSLIVEKCLIELKISPDKSLIQSSSRPERLQITEEVDEEKEKEEEDDGNETEGKQLIAHTN